MGGVLGRIVGLIDKMLNIVEITVLVITGVILLGSLFYAGVVRYAHLGSFPEEIELSWLLYSWMVFVGSSHVLRKGDHPHVSMLREKLGWWYTLVIYAISIAYLVVMLHILITYRYLYAVQRTAVMRLSLRYFYDAALVGFSFMIIRYVLKSIMVVHRRFAGEKL